MLRKYPPVDPVLSILSCFRKPSIGVCQVVSNSPDPGIAWPSTRFRPDLWRWFEEDTASIRRLIHLGYMAKQREATGLDNRGKWRLLSGVTDIFIPHEIRPFEAKDSLQAPLVQSLIHSSYVAITNNSKRISEIGFKFVKVTYAYKPFSLGAEPSLPHKHFRQHTKKCSSNLNKNNELKLLNRSARLTAPS